MKIFNKLKRFLWNFFQVGISLKVLTWYFEDTTNGLWAFMGTVSIVNLMIVLIDFNDMIQENKEMNKNEMEK